MAINHADNWQKQVRPSGREYSEVLRGQRQTGIKEGAEQAAKTMHGLQTAKASEKVEKPNIQASNVNQPAAAGRDVPQTVQRVRAETQTEAARHDLRASQQFLENRENARNLRQLETKSPLAKSGEDHATRTAVTQKGQTVEANLTKQAAGAEALTLARASAEMAAREAAKLNAAKLAANARKAAGEKGEPKGDAKETKGPKDAQPKNAETNVEAQKVPNAALQAGLRRAEAALAAQAGQIAQPALKNIEGAERNSNAKEGDNKAEGKKKEGETKQSGVVYARSTNAGGELNALLGGFAGGGEGSEGQSETASSALAAEAVSKEMPELDPHSHVYNEFDEARPGIEHVWSKAKLYDRVVEKKLVEIARLDQELGHRIRSLSERVVGDLKGEISLASFHRSVYGGLIG